MTETQSNAAGWRKVAPWAIGILLIVLVVPMATFGKNMLLDRRQQPAAAGSVKPVVSGGVPYRTKDLFVLKAGSGKMEADYQKGADGVLVSTVEVVAPSRDGRYVWIVDHPDTIEGKARVRRFSPKGELQLDFATLPASTFFTPGLDGDLWTIRSSGSGRERLTHYSEKGKLEGEYVLPEGLVTRSIALDPDGEVWVQYEEWVIDPSTNMSAYSSSLIPILKANHEPIKNVTPEMAADGSFLGPDDRLYVLSSKPRKQQENRYPPFLVVARDSKGDNLSEYDIDNGARPYAADGGGRVYTETMQADLAQAPGQSSLGDSAYNRVKVEVFTEKGSFAQLDVTREPSMGAWSPAAWPAADGTLYTWRWAEDGLHVQVTSQDERAKMLVTDGAYRKPDIRVLYSTTAPASGDPYRAIDAAQRDLWQAVYSGLVTHDSSLVPVPDLAEAVPTTAEGVSDDGLTIEWKIRSGRKWHDGKPVSGDDVVATWEYLRGATLVDRDEPFPGFGYIKDVTAQGDTVRVTLTRPYGPAPEAFFPYVLPAHVLKDATGQENGGLHAKPVGSGPYRVTRWEPARMQLERAADSKAAIGAIEVAFVDTDAAEERYMGADVPTVWSWVPDLSAQDVRRDAVGAVRDVRTGRWFGLVVNSRDRLVADPGVREALLDIYPSNLLNKLYQLPATETVAPFGQDTPVDSYGKGQASSAKLAAALKARGYTDKAPKDGWLDKSGANIRFRYSQTMRGVDAHETVSEVEEEYSRAAKKVKTILDWENGQHRYYAPVTGEGFLSRGRHSIGSGVFPGFIDAAWGSIFDPADTPSWSNAHGLGVTFTDDAELRSLHERARESYDPAERAALGAKIIERVRELRLAYFDRPEIRPVASLGVTGMEPGPFPAGLFHDVSSWKVEQAK